ncbi:TlpA family protein disulfide reductase [Colwellia sp. D2M02]|uniref:TlpA disulfide reductase family protein n=1 Tax=Colwellia sp. D2M02 TaxID=2841562 RepID=UPI001C0827A0|nr:TlpA disulfide reductase family protein [Colwellia sp. D2M02]MBU2892084.1 TlpA family protein disulfide reductase [Colwellia sp. D2M02]
MKTTYKLLCVLSATVLLSACQSTAQDNAQQASKHEATSAQADNPFIISQPKKSTSKYPEFVHSGDILPIREITSLEGKTISLQQVGKKKLVILFASWCSDSNRLLKALNNSPLLADDTIEVIAIAREENKATVKAWQQAHNIKTPLAVDIDRAIYKKFASGGIPRIITVAENNQIIEMNLAEGNEQLSQIVW